MQKLKELFENGYYLKEEFKTQEEFFKEAARVLSRDDVVNDGFHEAIIKREKEFPTGLQTLSIPVAIPHTEFEYVNKESILLCNLINPLEFRRMDNPEEMVQAEFAIMLLIKNKNNHMESLVELMELIQSDKLELLKKTSSYEECLSIISEVK